MDLGLKGNLACSPGTIMAVRSIRYRSTNLFTVVGCFSSLAEVPLEKEIREHLATSDSVERISARGDREFSIPPRILGHFLDYAKEWFNSLRAEPYNAVWHFVSKLTSKNHVASTPNICASISI
jgi:hypothetical protein